MKILNISLSLLSLLPLNASASGEELSVIAFYNQSRINTSQISNSTYGSSAYGGETGDFAGGGYGLFYEKPLKDKWSFETGLAYFTRGYSTKDSFSKDQDTYKWSSLYLPIEGRIRPNSFFTGFIGGYASYALGTVTKTSVYANSSSPNISTNDFQTLGFKPFEYGLTYGAGINWNINNATTFILEVRLNEGLSNIIDPSLSTKTNSTPNGTTTEEKAFMRETWVVVGFLI